MLRSMYSAISGLKAHQGMLDVTSNNIANVNTIAYKGARTTFNDQLSQLQQPATQATQTNGGNNPMQIGLGVRTGTIDTVNGPGAMQTTGNTLDMAIQGDGWFRVTNDGPDDPTSRAGAPAAAEAFTRAGNFTRNSAGFLVTPMGQYLMGKETAAAGAPNVYLRIPDGATDVHVGQDGQISYIDSATKARTTAGFVSLAKFPNEAGLERASGNLWRVSQSSGGEVPGGGALPRNDGTGVIVSGAIEMSNVDLATEFTTMVTAQRGFQANSRVITTVDSLLEELVNLKR